MADLDREQMIEDTIATLVRRYGGEWVPTAAVADEVGVASTEALYRAHADRSRWLAPLWVDGARRRARGRCWEYHVRAIAHVVVGRLV